ncbi:MAG: Hsp20/alpha crystallin family protein, partial [Alphaproteobacteria bacterium]|nr:Hsp20/alpha crystallin family protein [Alphaproteobacteria bacterium]
KAPTKAETTQPEVLHPLETIRQDIESMFERYLRNWPNVGQLLHWPEFEPFRSLEIPERLKHWGATPRIDVSETDKSYELTAEIPGMEEKDVEVTLTENMLTINGEKHEEREEKEKNYHVRERRYGSFHRTFTVPPDVDANKISAQFAKGVLTVNLPKTKKPRGKRRQISIRPN